jgi:hypothetical protein
MYNFFFSNFFNSLDCVEFDGKEVRREFLLVIVMYNFEASCLQKGGGGGRERERERERVYSARKLLFTQEIIIFI